MADVVPLHVWTMRNSLGPIPEELRGTAYNEHRLMVLGRVIMFGTQYHGDVCVYSILAHETAAEAYLVAITMTESLEHQGHQLHIEPKGLMYVPGTEQYYATRHGFHGADEKIDLAYERVLNYGTVIA